MENVNKQATDYFGALIAQEVANKNFADYFKARIASDVANEIYIDLPVWGECVEAIEGNDLDRLIGIVDRAETSPRGEIVEAHEYFYGAEATKNRFSGVIRFFE